MTSAPEKAPAAYRPQWSPWVRQLVTVGLVIAGVYGLVLLAPVFNIVATTFLLSFLMFVPARLIAQRSPLNYTLSVVLVFIVLVIAIVVLVSILVPGMADLVGGISRGVRSAFTEFQIDILRWEPDSGPFVVEIGPVALDITRFARQLREAILAGGEEGAQMAQEALLETLPELDIGNILGTATSVVFGVIGAFGQFLTTLFVGMLLSLAILLELPRYQHHIFDGLSRPARREVALLMTRINAVWVGFFRGQLLLCGMIGVVTFIQLVLMGVPTPGTLSIVVAVISLIPTIGGILALFPLALVPLLQGSTVFVDIPAGTFALLVVGINLVITQIIWNVIAPRIMGSAVNLPLPLIIVGIIIGAGLAGALGAFLIVPLMGTVRVVVLYLWAKVREQDPFPGEKTPQLEHLDEL